MFMKTKSTRLTRPGVFLLLFFLAVSLLILPKTSSAVSRIYLKDGRIIKVENFWREEGMVKYETFGGIIGIPLDEVEKIVTPDMVAFRKVLKLDTIGGYERFLREYPKSEYASQAEQRIKALQFEKVKRIDTASVYLDYIRRNPNSLFIQEARARAETLIFQDAVRENKIEKFMEYQKLYPRGKYARAAARAVEYLKYRQAAESADIGKMEAFLKEYSESSFQKDLTERIAMLQARAESRARMRQARQRQKMRKLQEERVKSKRRRRTILFSVGGLVGLAIPALFLILRRRRKEDVPSPDIDFSEVPFEESPAVPAREPKGPIRYEDIIGVPRHADSLALPEPDGKRGDDPDDRFALPEPEPGETAATTKRDSVVPAPSGADGGPERERVLGESGDKRIAPDPGEKGGSDAVDAEEDVVDLSNHESEFKLELEEIPGKADRAGAEPSFREEEIDLSEGDLPHLLDDEETRRRRGGGESGDV